MNKAEKVRFKIGQLLKMKDDGVLTDDDIKAYREKGLVIETRKKEIRAIKGTNLIPKFYYKTPLGEPMTPLAYQLQEAVNVAIEQTTEVLAQMPVKPKKKPEKKPVKKSEKDNTSSK